MDTVQHEDERSVPAAVEELCELFTKAGMIRECEKRGLVTAGSKRDLATRVVEHDATMVPHDGADGEAARNNDDNDDNNDDDDKNDDDGDASDISSVATSTRFYTPGERTMKAASTPITSADRRTERRSYAFRDVEDSIDTFGGNDDGAAGADGQNGWVERRSEAPDVQEKTDGHRQPFHVGTAGFDDVQAAESRVIKRICPICACK
uniref:SAP domain-containing protein n=1 Tax=Anopheles darlingi TaxID=43151 RepID=A0A2M4CX82_ANODA